MFFKEALALALELALELLALVLDLASVFAFADVDAPSSSPRRGFPGDCSDRGLPMLIVPIPVLLVADVR